MLRASITSLVLVALIIRSAAFDLVVINEADLSVFQKLYIAPAKTKNCATTSYKEARLSPALGDFGEPKSHFA
jgi:hypothetical protein